MITFFWLIFAVLVNKFLNKHSNSAVVLLSAVLGPCIIGVLDGCWGDGTGDVLCLKKPKFGPLGSMPPHPPNTGRIFFSPKRGKLLACPISVVLEGMLHSSYFKTNVLLLR